MSMTDFDKTRRFTKYKRHVDESHERISADHINKIQEDVDKNQVDLNNTKDKAFEERVYTIFNNNLYTNAMFIDYFRTGEYQNQHESSDTICIKPMKRQLTLKPDAADGTAISMPIYSAYGQGVRMNDFFLIVNEIIPIGAKVKYYLETYKGERWNILPNALKLPMHISEDIQYGVKLVIEMAANVHGEAPCINGYALLYWDAQVEENYGLTNPDLKRFP